MTRITGANAPQPYLSVWDSSQEAIRGNEFIAVNLVGSGFDINRNEFAVVLFLQSGANLRFIDCIPEAGKIFFAVTWLGIHTTILRMTNVIYTGFDDPANFPCDRQVDEIGVIVHGDNTSAWRTHSLFPVTGCLTLPAWGV